MKEKLEFLKRCSFSNNVSNNITFIYTSALVKSQPETIKNELKMLKNTLSYGIALAEFSFSLLKEFISFKETPIIRALLLSGNKHQIQLALNLILL